MTTTKISPKYQIVIPKEIRKKYNFKSGEEVVVLPYEGRIEIVKEKDIKSMRGFLKGMDTKIIREDDRL